MGYPGGGGGVPWGAFFVVAVVDFVIPEVSRITAAFGFPVPGPSGGSKMMGLGSEKRCIPLRNSESS
jgi:hypothetical protein